MHTKVGVLPHGSSGGVVCLIMLFSHEFASPFSSLSPFFNNLSEIPEFRPMGSCKHAQPYLYDSSIVPEEASLSGS